MSPLEIVRRFMDGLSIQELRDELPASWTQDMVEMLIRGYMLGLANLAYKRDDT